MKSIRRLGVEAGFGSLSDYCDHVVQQHADCATRLHTSVNDTDHAAALTQALANIGLDLKWCNAELVKDAT